MRLRDLAGRVFGRLTVLRYVGSRLYAGRARPHWLCRCACGAEVTKIGEVLLGGRTRSCGERCPLRKKPPCGIDGCGRPHFGNGLCSRHWKQARRRDRPEAVRAADRRYHAKNRSRENEKHRQSYRRHRAARLAYARDYLRRLREERPAALQQTKRRHYLKHRSAIRGKQNRASAELADSYVRFLLGVGADSTIPPALIEAKRAQLQLHRLTRKKK